MTQNLTIQNNHADIAQNSPRKELVDELAGAMRTSTNNKRATARLNSRPQASMRWPSMKASKSDRKVLQNKMDTLRWTSSLRAASHAARPLAPQALATASTKRSQATEDVRRLGPEL